MKINSYFENISEILKKEILKSEKSIKIAMCYFTNINLIKILANKSFSGIKVDIILDENASLRTKNFEYASQLGCNVSISSHSNIMHHKFCIIDNKILITGSYNWTINANKNLENIIVINKKDQIIDTYINEFKSLKYSCKNKINAKNKIHNNPLLTPLIYSRFKNWKSISSSSFLWTLKENPFLKWSSNYSWHPLQKKEVEISDLFKINNKEKLILKNKKMFEVLNAFDFSIKTKCNYCKEKLVTRWFMSHLLYRKPCPNCKNHLN